MSGTSIDWVGAGRRADVDRGRRRGHPCVAGAGAPGREVRRQHRRQRSLTDEDSQTLSFADIRLARGRSAAWRRGRPLRLTRTECSLLQVLTGGATRVLTRDMLFEAIWGEDMSATADTLQVYVGYLRRQLEAEGEGDCPHAARHRMHAAEDSSVSGRLTRWWRRWSLRTRLRRPAGSSRSTRGGRASPSGWRRPRKSG